MTRQTKIFYFLVLLFFLIFIFYKDHASALFVDWSDDFESYTAGGNLSGQGLWTGDIDYDVSTASPSTGTNHVNVAGPGDIDKLTGFDLSSTTAALISFSGYLASDVTSEIMLGAFSASTRICSIGLRNISGVQKWSLLGLTATGYQNQTTVTAGAYYQLDLLLDFSDDTCKGRINSGAWSDSVGQNGPTLMPVDRINIDKDDSTLGRIDDINTVTGALAEQEGAEDQRSISR